MTPGRSEGMLQLSDDDSSELSLLERRVTVFAAAVGMDDFRRRKSTEVEEKSTVGVMASELRRVADLEDDGDLPLVNVNRRLSLWVLVSVFSALFASSGLPVKERAACLYYTIERDIQKASDECYILHA